MVVKRRLERMQEERYFAILYAAGFTRDEVGKPGGLPFIGKRIEFDDPRYSAMKEAQAENLRMEAAKMELLRAWYRDYRHTSNEPDSKSNSITDAVSDENQADARPSPVIASSRVQLYGRSDPPLIDGTPSAALTAAQYDVVQALLAAGEKGLTKDALDRKSGRGDARKILSRLAKRDPKWEAVIAFAGKSGMGYRIL
jgi:hypothetical protein